MTRPALALGLAGLALAAGAARPAAAADQPDRYAAAVARMQELHRQRAWQKLADEFGAEDIAGWPAPATDRAAAAFHLRGQAWGRLGEPGKAGPDLEAAVARAPGNGYYWHDLAEHWRPRDGERALAAYLRAWSAVESAHADRSFALGWMPASATLGAAALLRDRGNYDEALALLARYDEALLARLAVTWRVRLLRARAQVLAGAGREATALADFEQALALEAGSPE